MLDKVEGLNSTKVAKAPIGFSGDDVYLIEKGYQGKDVVVKIGKRKEVYEEAQNLIWLQDKIAVPKVYQTGKVEDSYYCIMEKIPGKMLQETWSKETIEENITQYAKALKTFHDINPEGLPFNHTLESKIAIAHQIVVNGKAKTEYFEREFAHMSGQEVYDLMQTYKYNESDLVLCHGDVCLPNLMVTKNQEIVFIDVVQLGIVDRHLDLAIALRTLHYNLEAMGETLTDSYIQVFKDAYGITKIDKNKLMFHILLDEITNG